LDLSHTFLSDKVAIIRLLSSVN